MKFGDQRYVLTVTVENTGTKKGVHLLYEETALRE